MRKTDRAGRFVHQIFDAGSEYSSIEVDLEGRRKHIIMERSSGLKSIEQLRIRGDIEIKFPELLKIPALLDLSMRYCEGVETLIRECRLRSLTLYASSNDVTHLLPDTLSEAEFKCSDGLTLSAANLASVSVLSFERVKQLTFTPTRFEWPEIVSIIDATQIMGLVESSNIAPMRSLFISGVRAPTPGASIWDVRADRVTVDFTNIPPAWLRAQWADRPRDWAERFRVPPHSSLQGSYDQDFPEA